MKTDAAPHYRIMAGIMLMAYVGCIGYVLLKPDPSQTHSMLAPFAILFLTMSAFFIPYYRDHAGVTYEVAGGSVILWRKGEMRKRIRLTDVTSVRIDPHKKCIILNRKGFWRGPIYLHPKTNADGLFEAIYQSAGPAVAGGRRPSASQPEP